MKRRDFLTRVAPLAAVPFALNGLPVRAFSRPGGFVQLASMLGAEDRIIVLIQLSGGNDGVNTVIPLDQYSAYAGVRANIAIPQNKVLNLTSATGVHPSMTDMQVMHNNGLLRTVQGVSYPNPNQSHFRATDIWMSGSSYNTYLESGWVGRFLDYSYPGFPTGYPSAAMPDPPAIQIGATISLALQGPSALTGIAIQDPQTFYNLVNGVPGGGTDTPPNTPAGHELTYIRQVQSQSQAYSTVIKSAADKATNKATYPTPDAGDRTPLSEQLKVVARLIAGGLKTRVYIVSIGGFDTHNNQTDATDTTIGSHATLLRRLSQAIAAFQNDLALLGVADKVIGMTFSEFGRRVASNASRGTDHGTAEPMFVFGSMVEPGVLGANPSLTDLVNGNLKMQFDYRQVYVSILRQWFDVSPTYLTALVPGTFTEVPIIRAATGVRNPVPDGFALAQNFPNPCAPATTIEFSIPSELEVHLAVYDVRGREVATLVRDRRGAGTYVERFHAGSLPSGTYVYRLRAGSLTASRMMTVQR